MLITLEDLKSLTTTKKELRVPEDIKLEFDEIKKQRNFTRMVFHNYFHYFYGVEVAYSAMKMYKKIQLEIDDDNKLKILKDLHPMTGKRSSPSIGTKELAHHDDLFKTIAYWYKMKQKHPQCYQVLFPKREENKKEKWDPRDICEMFFIDKWKEFRQKIGTIGTKYPDILLYKILLKEKEE